MATMTLPATNVELPSDTFSMNRFTVLPSYSEETISFKGNFALKGAKKYALVCNSGLGEDSIFEWYSAGKEEFKARWEEFIAECGMDEETVIQLFVEEMIQQQNFNNIVGTVVRTEDGDKIFRKSPENLRGQVQGTYWDRKAKNWVSLNG